MPRFSFCAPDLLFAKFVFRNASLVQSVFLIQIEPIMPMHSFAVVIVVARLLLHKNSPTISLSPALFGDVSER